MDRQKADMDRQKCQNIFKIYISKNFNEIFIFHSHLCLIR